MSIEEKKLNLDTYFVEWTYNLKTIFTANTGNCYSIREYESGLDILYADNSLFYRRYNIYVDEQRQNPCLTAKRITGNFFSHSKYIVQDRAGAVIGYIKEKFSIFEPRWEILNSSGVIIGGLQGIFKLRQLYPTLHRKYYFDFVIERNAVGRAKVCTSFWENTWTAEMDLTADTEKKIDRRLALVCLFFLRKVASGGSL